MKKAIIAIVVVVALIAGGFLLLGGNKDSDQNNQAAQPSTSQGSAQQEESMTEREQPLPQYLQGANVREVKTATGQSEVMVEVGDIYYDPTVLTISKGTKVTWENVGSIDHTVTSADGSPQSGLNSGTLKPGETYTFTFDQPGDYNYFCEFHSASQKGVVIVKE